VIVIGKTGRPLGVRVKEHRKEVENITGVYTRADKTRAASICNKLAITDHVCNENHVIDWDSVKAIDHEANKTARHIAEAIWIRKSNSMNRDEGNYILSNIRNRTSVLMKTSDRRSKRQR